MFDPFLKNDSGNYSAKENFPKLKFLLDNGVDPNGFGIMEKWKWFARHGDSFAKTSNKVEELSTPVWWLAWRQDPTLELVRVLLAKGAKPGPALGSIVDAVAMRDEDGSLVNTLFARPHEIRRRMVAGRA